MQAVWETMHGRMGSSYLWMHVVWRWVWLITMTHLWMHVVWRWVWLKVGGVGTI